MSNTESINGKIRYLWIDMLKGFGMLLVLIGHNSLTPEGVNNYVYSFHVPLFFFMSGMVSDFKKGNFIGFLKKKFKQLIIPYFSFGIVFLVYMFFIGSRFGSDANNNITILDYCKGLLYGNGNFWPIWFLTALFSGNIVVYLAFKIVYNDYLLLLISIIVFFVTNQFIKSDFYLPYELSIVFGTSFFIIAGNFIKKYLSKINTLKNNYKFVICLFFLSIGFFLSTLNGRVDMNSMKFNNDYLFIASSLFSICGFILLFSLLPVVKSLMYVGKNSLIILCLHILVGGAILFIIKGWIIDTTTLNGISSFIIVFLTVVFQIIILIPIINLINNRFPYMLGKF